jgi:hypothetical protein
MTLTENEKLKLVRERNRHIFEEIKKKVTPIQDTTTKTIESRENERKMEYALECIVFYNRHYEWLEKLADEIENTKDLSYGNPLDISEWHSEKHCIWMLLVGMFGDWGTSIRGGWIEETKECANYIRELCRKAKGEETEDDDK